MPKQTKYIKAQVQKLIDRASMYAGKSARYRRTADLKFRRIGGSDPQSPGQTDAEFAYMNPDLDNWDWDSDGQMQSSMDTGQTMRKDYACLSDMGADEALDAMIETIGKMRAAGATRSDMNRAWAIYSSAQS